MDSNQHTFGHQLAVVIPTKDRPAQLHCVLSSIQGQSFQPQQVIVVDGGDNTVEGIVEQFPDLHIDYLRVYPPALTKQKNAGVGSVGPGITLIGFVDDDMIFENCAMAAMMRFWEQAPEELGGASFNLPDFDHSWQWVKSFPQRLFFIDNRGFGRVRRSGFNTPIWNAPDDRYVQWLGGGYTVWRKRIFDHWHFDEWFTGSGLWEDVHFSYRVGQQYRLAVVAAARAAHVEPSMAAKGQVRLGKTQILNWLYFVRNNPDLSVVMCLWACVGRTATNLSKGVVRFNLAYILRALGNSLGLVTGAVEVVNPHRQRNSA